MTANQINYWNLQENVRSHLANEFETNRHNVASETEINRHNLVTEVETNRHNVVTENETNRHNLVSESIGRTQAAAASKQADAAMINAKSNAYYQTELIKINQASQKAQQKYWEDTIVVNKANADTSRINANTTRAQYVLDSDKFDLYKRTELPAKLEGIKAEGVKDYTLASTAVENATTNRLNWSTNNLKTISNIAMSLVGIAPNVGGSVDTPKTMMESFSEYMSEVYD